MKILIIRHAEPDYEHDSLTEKGFREAEFLAERLSRAGITSAYVSPLGRARATAAPTLKMLGMEAEECGWLREFDVKRIRRPDVSEKRMIPWDWLPQDWSREPSFYQAERWKEHPVMKEAGVGTYYDYVTEKFDELLVAHGYRREGKIYRVERENEEVLALFCHFGSGCVLLSHILCISPMILWHGITAAPSSVTTVITEERRQGIASLRCQSIGDVSHLYANDESISFAARFCECFHHEEERHD